MRVNVWFLTTPGQLGVFSPLKPEPSSGQQPSFIIDLVLKDRLAGPLYRRVSECVCVSVGAQVMSFLTAVERHCYCSAPLIKASTPPPLVNTHTFHPPSSQLLTSPPYKLFLSQLWAHCERLCNSDNRDLIDFPCKSSQVTQLCATELKQSSSIIRPVGNESTCKKV